MSVSCGNTSKKICGYSHFIVHLPARSYLCDLWTSYFFMLKAYVTLRLSARETDIFGSNRKSNGPQHNGRRCRLFTFSYCSHTALLIDATLKALSLCNSNYAADILRFIVRITKWLCMLLFYHLPSVRKYMYAHKNVFKYSICFTDKVHALRTVTYCGLYSTNNIFCVYILKIQSCSYLRPQN